jgi:glycosyltransferase involved in cell wall biosynthesis
MRRALRVVFPELLHILTYDVRGSYVHSGQVKPARTTGVVTHTHQVLGGLARAAPRTRLAITCTGNTRGAVTYLRTPEGHVALLQGVRTAFPEYLAAPGQPGKDPARVDYFYEQDIDSPGNPVYQSLAQQYAHVIRVAGTRHLLAQNINPIVSCLKAEQFGCLPADGVGPLNLTGAVHDLAGAARRFGYLRDRLGHTCYQVKLIAVSSAVRDGLLDLGIPHRQVFTVPNGLDVAGFQDRLDRARAGNVFATVRARNDLPAEGAMVLVSARRVGWKGHIDVIDAVTILAARGRRDFFVVFNGNSMVDTREPDYEHGLHRRITTARLTDRVFLLDNLTPDEVAACYDAADIALHPSRLPEAWGYANVEAMLAGCVVIASGHGGPLDYITHNETGLLVRPRDPHGLADTLDDLLARPAADHAHLAERGRAAATRFTTEAMVAGYQTAILADPHDPRNGSDLT